MRTDRWRAILFCGCGLVPPVLAGCGPDTATVTGKVHFRQPPATPEPMSVSLTGPNGRPVTAEVEPDGSYQARGVEVGKVKVSLTCIPAAFSEADAAYQEAQEAKEAGPSRPVRKTKGKGKGPAGPPDLAKYPNPVPKQYWDPDKSPLSLTTRPGANEFDIQVAN